LDATAHTFGIRRPVTLLQSADPGTLGTCGVCRPRVLVPSYVRHWSIQVVASLLQSLYWFHPLVWMAHGRCDGKPSAPVTTSSWRPVSRVTNTPATCLL